MDKNIKTPKQRQLKVPSDKSHPYSLNFPLDVNAEVDSILQWTLHFGSNFNQHICCKMLVFMLIKMLSLPDLILTEVDVTALVLIGE